MIQYTHEDRDIDEYNQRQMRWEKELGEYEGSEKRTRLVKQVLLPYFHTLQKNAIKQLNAQDKQQVLLLSQQLK